MIKTFVVLMLMALVTVPLAANAAGGNCVWVNGQASPSHQYCVEQLASEGSGGNIPKVPHGSVHVNSPECGNAATAADAVQRRMDGARKSASGAGATALFFYGGPIGVGAAAVAGILGEIAAMDIKNNSPGNSYCRVLCVHLPPDAKSIDAFGWMTRIPYDNALTIRCSLGNENCNASYGSFTAMQARTDAETGSVMCTMAKNWSDTDQRMAGLRVEYDR